MSRGMGADDTELWRAVVTWKYTRTDDSHFETTLHHGPYRTRGAAKAAISRERRDASEWRSREITSSHIQRGSIQWEDA